MRFSKKGLKVFTNIMIGAFTLIMIGLILVMPVTIENYKFIAYCGAGMFTFLNVLETISKSII